MKSKLLIQPGGIKSWRLNGQLHRENGPAVEYPDGSKFWYLNGKCHREDGPAVEYANGSKYWYVNGQRHREDGPAVDLPDGIKEWWLNSKKLTKKQLLSKKMKINYLKLHNNYLVYHIMNS